MNRPRPAVIFRADASAEMGLGHLMRCRAVAEGVVDLGGRVVFAMVDPAPAFLALLNDVPAEVICLPGPAGGDADLAALQALVARVEPVCTVVDGYHLSDQYQCAVARVTPLAVLWDAADRTPVPASVVIDPSPQASAQAYRAIAPEAQMLLGPRYALIRRDIREAIRAPRTALAERSSLVLSFGGSDPLSLTGPVAQRLVANLPSSVTVTALVGAAYPRPQDLRDLAVSLSPRLRVEVNPPSVAPVFAAAGLVVTAAGGTIGELVALGAPALAVVVAQNQAPTSGGPYPCLDGRAGNAADLIARHAVALWNDYDARASLVQRVAGLVDGEGAVRIAGVLLSKFSSEGES
jgi:UDP-2,4-diacetamido-2,4,6-trideoxy-beta-L-altropyranose hydrolase